MNAVSTRLRCPVCGFDVPADTIDRAHEGPLRCAKPFCGVELWLTDAGRLRVHTFRLANHYSLCVLPFSIPERDGFDANASVRQSGRWRERVFTTDNAEDIDRTEYFLPYIRRFLFPSLDRPAGAEATALNVPCERWTFDLARLGKVEQAGLPLALRCRDTRKDLAWEYDLVLESIELVLFSYRVGFLILRFGGDADATLFDQMNALSFLRPIAPLYRGYEMPTLAAGGQSFRMSQLLPYLLAELQGEDTAPAGPAALPERAALPVKAVYDDRMMVYTYSCIDRTSCLADLDHSQKLISRASVINFEEAEAATPAPSPGEDARTQWLRTRWQAFSKEGGSLVVFDTDEFHRRYLGVYHGTYYFDIFLLATLQRVTLLTLFERLSDISALTKGGWRSRGRLRRVRRDLLLFKNQCCFSQITNRERGLVLWRKWHDVFENRTLLDEVNEQSGELDTYLQGRMRERMERLVRLGGFLVTAVPAVLGLEVILPPKEWGAWVTPLRWSLFGLLLAGSGLFAWLTLRQGDE
jgi:hypothetical protein